MPDVNNYSLTIDESPQYQLDVDAGDAQDLRVEEKVEAKYYTIFDLNTGKPVRFWFGTLAEYNALPEIFGDVCYNIQEASCYVG